MRRHLAMWIGALSLLASAARAETQYIIDRLQLPVYATAAEGQAVRTVDTGAVVEVLERGARFARIRDRQGNEGWIDARYLSADPPARAQTAKLQEDLARVRAQHSDAENRIKQSEAALAQQSAKNAELTRELAAAQAATPNAPSGEKPAPAADPDKAKPAAPPPAAGDAGAMTAGQLLLGALAVFAMLVMGFVAGMWWQRESIRRRSGGMYLRV